ncbi:MAG: DUF2202 domain-containing protein [Akkermansiaceae bacterium]|nr:DUF2202 domain-containing protein [Akkermansiaceae bacterium]MCP5544616.1 DUF2202 domain-containing protein [Akkermansiaceae bacterium]
MKTTLSILLSAFAFVSSVRAADPADLVRLYEEEILAHDLYVALGKAYPDIMPFRNIPQSEARHREALGEVLRKEGVGLPKARGKKRFVSPGLDAIYRKWLKEGRQSEQDACRVGVRLEEHDIADLRAAQKRHPKHKAVLAELEAASNNHLRAFHRNLTRFDGRYDAEVLGKAGLRAILDDESAGSCGSEDECGSCGGGCGRRGGNGKVKGNGNGGRGKGNGYRGGR